MLDDGEVTLSMIESEDESAEEEVKFIKQYVHDVADFSSQYGSDISISYTAYNITGKPSKFPDYGDFPQAFVMRTYGNWWNEAPSRRETFMSQNYGKIISHDFIDITFDDAVYPFQVSIYETYNPGSVVRIWAGSLTGEKKWVLLWEGESQVVGHKPRIFTPPIRPLDFPTRLLRLEFDHTKLEYYTELDAVLLVGTKKPVGTFDEIKSTMKSILARNTRLTEEERKRIACLDKLLSSTEGFISDPEEDTADESELETTSRSEEEDEEEASTETARESDDEGEVAVLGLVYRPEEEAASPVSRAEEITVSTETSPVSACKAATEEDRRTQCNVCHSLGRPVRDLTKHIMELNIHSIPPQVDIEDTLTTFLAEDYKQILKQLEETGAMLTGAATTIGINRANSGPFSHLPDETVLYIFTMLDLASLGQCAKVNRHFHQLATDSLLYTELNLKPYWHSVNGKMLTTLSAWCKHLTKLDLSWCGSYEQITTTQFQQFLEECGKQMTHLRLDCCRFVEDSVIKTIANVCQNVKELTLRNCSRISTDGFNYLATLKCLERIDLYRTAIETGPLVSILKASPRLKHINLGSCVRVSSMDEVAQALGTYNRQLVTVDFWKTYSLTPLGVRALSNCSLLEEVDFGWCLGVSIPGDCMTALAMGCPRLRKLFMAALRGIVDRDLEPFLKYCPHLQQVDLLGVRSITADVCYKFLRVCKELRLLDLSFCEQIMECDVLEWRRRFPRVSIKRSFQYEGSGGCYLPNHY